MGPPPQSRAYLPDRQQKPRGNHQASKPEGPSSASSLLDCTTCDLVRKRFRQPQNGGLQDSTTSFQLPAILKIYTLPYPEKKPLLLMTPNITPRAKTRNNTCNPHWLLFSEHPLTDTNTRSPLKRELFLNSLT